MARYYIGFGCGTMGTKTALYRDDSVRMAGAYREKHHLISPSRKGGDGSCGFVRNVEEGIRECLHKSGVNPHDIRGISASGIICGIVGINENWEPVTPFVPYLDNRARCEAEWVKENVERLARRERQLHS